MILIQIIFLMSLAQVQSLISSDNLHVFVNRFHVNHTAYIITTLETLGDIWFSTKVNINERRLVDLFQTNITEAREQLLWYPTTSLKKTLDFYSVFSKIQLPYEKCFYHVSRVNFFKSGYHNVSVTISTNGLSTYEKKSLSYISIDLEENIRCEPSFDVPRCHDANRPLHYDTSEVIVLRAVFSRRCPMDNFIRYYWTLHDSTENRKFI